ncbi:MAG TPA: nucleotidyltransferase domain-containing protein [Solirubrobacterales bacterium]|jgi:predicted nucleotidyltransferase
MGIAITETLITEVSRRLSAATPDAKVILFGSHARGDARPDSDLDLLVIEPELKSRRAESVRLRDALGNLGVPVDLIVVPASHVDEWGHFEGTMLNNALSEGRVLLSPGVEDQTDRQSAPTSSSSPSHAKGTPGARSLRSGDTRLAASPTISRFLTTAS